jgi:hypothetical protein
MVEVGGFIELLGGSEEERVVDFIAVLDDFVGG